jgi:hypothetical protein
VPGNVVNPAVPALAGPVARTVRMLPFTGLSLLACLLGGAALTAAGLGLLAVRR